MIFKISVIDDTGQVVFSQSLSELELHQCLSKYDALQNNLKNYSETKINYKQKEKDYGL